MILGGRPRRLLDEVDLISTVSGGSFTAAYYGLYGDRIFRDFATEFLKRPVERSLILQLFRPRNRVRLGAFYLNRSKLAVEYYDEPLFKGATFADLERGSGPEILINATDLSTGSRFSALRGAAASPSTRMSMAATPTCGSTPTRGVRRLSTKGASGSIRSSAGRRLSA